MKILKLIITLLLVAFVGNVFLTRVMPGIRLSNMMRDIAQEQGLKDVRIELEYLDPTLWGADVYCSNFEQFEPEQMVLIAENLHANYWQFGKFFFMGLGYINSNGLEYKFPSYEDNTIYLYGQKVYNANIDRLSGDYRPVSKSEKQYWYAVTFAKEVVLDSFSADGTVKFSSLDTDNFVERNGNSYKVTGKAYVTGNDRKQQGRKWEATFDMTDSGGSGYNIESYQVKYEYQ